MILAHHFTSVVYYFNFWLFSLEKHTGKMCAAAGWRGGGAGEQKALSGGDKGVVAVQPPPFIYLSYLQMAA